MRNSNAQLSLDLVSLPALRPNPAIVALLATHPLAHALRVNRGIQIETNQQIDILFTSLGFQEACGYRACETCGAEFVSLLIPESVPVLDTALGQLLRAQGGEVQFDLALKVASGTSRIVEFRVRRREGEMPGFTFFGTDVTVVRQEAQRLHKELSKAKRAVALLKTQCELLWVKSNTDPLTQAFSRGYLKDVLPDQLTSWPLKASSMWSGDRRRRGRSSNGQEVIEVVSVLLIDLNEFKGTNDIYGHGEGDQALKDTILTLRNVCREGDVIIRYGGDEVLVIAKSASKEDALELGNRIWAHIAFAGGSLRLISPAIGVATYTRDMGPMTRDELIDLADKAMYRAKKGGLTSPLHSDEL